jgi:hypothetical protein
LRSVTNREQSNDVVSLIAEVLDDAAAAQAFRGRIPEL